MPVIPPLTDSAASLFHEMLLKARAEAESRRRMYKRDWMPTIPVGLDDDYAVLLVEEWRDAAMPEIRREIDALASDLMARALG